MYKGMRDWRARRKHTSVESGQRPARFQWLHACAFSLLLAACCFSQVPLDDHRIARFNVKILNGPNSPASLEDYRQIIGDTLGQNYSAPRIRDTIEALYGSRKVETVTVDASSEPNGDVVLTFNLKLKTQAQKVSVVIGPYDGD